MFSKQRGGKMTDLKWKTWLWLTEARRFDVGCWEIKELWKKDAVYSASFLKSQDLETKKEREE